jgi:peptidoglycan/xylan/chitin deacetylase (PgdA/CDA1 family)
MMSSVNNNKGVFVISLDYELLWGVWDVKDVEKYGNNIIGVKAVIPRLLELFSRHDLKVTFATVGILFAKNKNELLPYLPENRPQYLDPAYNVYQQEFGSLGFDETDDPFHFGHTLFELIKQSPHEMATHTFSHYFCLESGQTAAAFDADLKAANKIASAQGINMTSIVFPRNQVNPDYFSVLLNNGITVYRGNPVSWIYKPRKFSAEVPLVRLCRLLDTYFPVSGYNTHIINRDEGLPVNIPASRFLKPYNKYLAWLEKWKLKRIMNEMTHAAENNELYHLWWHPHNFGINIEKNIQNLAVLLNHYQYLKNKYGFSNCTMKEAAGL